MTSVALAEVCALLTVTPVIDFPPMTVDSRPMGDFPAFFNISSVITVARHNL